MSKLHTILEVAHNTTYVRSQIVNGLFMELRKLITCCRGKDPILVEWKGVDWLYYWTTSGSTTGILNLFVVANVGTINPTFVGHRDLY
jgi:hypothetical protein